MSVITKEKEQYLYENLSFQILPIFYSGEHAHLQQSSIYSPTL